MVCRVVKIRTRILKVGKLNRVSPDSGFTLIELIAVLFIIGIMLAFTIPEFGQQLTRDDTKTALNWIVLNTGKLKTEARSQAKDFFMCINTDTNTISIHESLPVHGSQDSEAISDFPLPDDITLDGVEFNIPGQENRTRSCIQFYKEGYSDPAILHLSNTDGNKYSCLIQPFLHKVKIHDDYIRFE